MTQKKQGSASYQRAEQVQGVKSQSGWLHQLDSQRIKSAGKAGENLAFRAGTAHPPFWGVSYLSASTAGRASSVLGLPRCDPQLSSRPRRGVVPRGQEPGLCPELGEGRRPQHPEASILSATRLPYKMTTNTPEQADPVEPEPQTQLNTVPSCVRRG